MNNDERAIDLGFRVLTTEDLVAFDGFSCGDEAWHEELHGFLRENALPEGEQLLNVTYAFYSAEGTPVAYAALSTGQVSNGQPPLVPGAEYAHVPALLIGRLAVDRRFQRRGIGQILFRWIRDTARELPVGCRFLALHVDVRNKEASAFYEKHGFFPAPIKGKTMQLMLYDLLEPTETEREGEGPSK